METIDHVLAKFLVEQNERLKPRTYGGYRSVIELFSAYLNNYGYNHLSQDRCKRFEERHGDDPKFCEMFEVEEISDGTINEFLSYFMIRKVVVSKSLLKNTGVVMRKLVHWLRDNSYVDAEHFAALEESVLGLKDELPKVDEFADLLWEEADKHAFLEYEDYTEGMFSICKIEPTLLWLEDYLEMDDIGPVSVAPKISKAAKKGWSMYLELGKKQGTWFIVGSGNVYPY